MDRGVVAIDLSEDSGVLLESVAVRDIDATSRLIQGSTVETLLDYCARRGARMIVVGSRGRDRLREAVPGSVSGALVRAARLPVLVVPLGD